MGGEVMEKQEVLERKISVTNIIQEVKDIICDSYCKYPEAYDDTEELIEERCDNCVLERL